MAKVRRKSPDSPKRTISYQEQISYEKMASFFQSTFLHNSRTIVHTDRPSNGGCPQLPALPESSRHFGFNVATIQGQIVQTLGYPTAMSSRKAH
jgi:hypothetical protein